MTKELAEELIGQAIEADLQNLDFDLPSENEMLNIGIMFLHKVYYDAGYAQHPTVKELLKTKKNGRLASLLKFVINERVERGEYKRDTLVKMYNLIE